MPRKRRQNGKGRLPRHTPGKMNGLEEEYYKTLKANHNIVRIRFEEQTFILAQRTSYMPDFVVQLSDGTIEIHEVKGHWTSSARVKIKVAAQKFDEYRFIAITKNNKKQGGGWKIEEFPSR